MYPFEICRVNINSFCGVFIASFPGSIPKRMEPGNKYSYGNLSRMANNNLRLSFWPLPHPQAVLNTNIIFTVGK